MLHFASVWAGNFWFFASFVLRHAWLKQEVKGELHWPVVTERIPSISSRKSNTPHILLVGGALATDTIVVSFNI